MRECFRAKKLGNFSKKHDWNRASNVVIKRYKEEVDEAVLFEATISNLNIKIIPVVEY